MGVLRYLFAPGADISPQPTTHTSTTYYVLLPQVVHQEFPSGKHQDGNSCSFVASWKDRVLIKTELRTPHAVTCARSNCSDFFRYFQHLETNLQIIGRIPCTKEPYSTHKTLGLRRCNAC